MRDARQISSGGLTGCTTARPYPDDLARQHGNGAQRRRSTGFRTPQLDRISTYPSVHQAADLRHQARDSDEQRRPAGVRVGRDHAPSHGRSHHWFDVTANFRCGG